MLLLVLTMGQQSCASLAVEAVLRIFFLPLDLAFRDMKPSLEPPFDEEKKRLEKDWLLAATTQRYSFLSYKSRPAYGLKLGSYVGESHFFGLSFRAMRDRKYAEVGDFGEIKHNFELRAAELQYAYYFEFAFINFGAGSRYAKMMTYSRETGEEIYALSPQTVPMASVGLGLEYQLSSFTFSVGSQWNFVGNVPGKREYFSSIEHQYVNDTLTKGLAKESNYSELYFQVGFSPHTQ